MPSNDRRTHYYAVPPRPTFNEQWRKQASCADDEHPDRWVDLPPVRVRGKNNPAYDERLNDLTETCLSCPVRDHCLWESLDINVRGVFAGTDEYERADIREALGLPTPKMVPAPENDEDARVMEQQFNALRLARRGYTNTEIAQALDVSAMTISRFTASEDRPATRRWKHRTDTVLIDDLDNLVDGLADGLAVDLLDDLAGDSPNGSPENAGSPEDTSSPSRATA